MQIENELVQVKPEKEALVTVGVFDGVHLGHQRLLNYLKDKARENGWLSGVVTFKSHPRSVLSPENELRWLTDLDTRVGLLRGLEVDFVVVLSFTTELAQLSASEFVRLLKRYLNMRGLIVGPDFALGKNREGTGERLWLLGQEIGFSVEVIEAVVVDGEVVSSSAIRRALADGDMGRVEKLFGRPFSLNGEIVTGDRRGRELGFPTANLDIAPEQALPKDGVYVTIAHVDRELVPSVTNIGVRPTFGGGKRMVETFLLDFHGDLLGRRLTIDLLDKLRDERYFSNVEELKLQMEDDVKRARAILARRMKQWQV